MARILFIVFIVFLVWLLVRVLGGRRRDSGAASAPAVDVPPRPAESMAQCAWCGTHVPTSHAITVTDGRTYCSVAHRDAAGGA